MTGFTLLYSAPDGRELYRYGAFATMTDATDRIHAAEAMRCREYPNVTCGRWRVAPIAPIKFNPALAILSAEAQVRLDQRAIDDLDSLEAPARWGDIDVASIRSELIAARDEHQSEVDYLRSQLHQHQAGAQA